MSIVFCTYFFAYSMEIKKIHVQSCTQRCRKQHSKQLFSFINVFNSTSLLRVGQIGVAVVVVAAVAAAADPFEAVAC